MAKEKGKTKPGGTTFAQEAKKAATSKKAKGAAKRPKPKGFGK